VLKERYNITKRKSIKCSIDYRAKKDGEEEEKEEIGASLII